MQTHWFGFNISYDLMKLTLHGHYSESNIFKGTYYLLFRKWQFHHIIQAGCELQGGLTPPINA